MENKKTEKFGLLNLLQVISGQYEHTEDEGAQQNTGGAAGAQTDGAEDNKQAANIVACVIERHERISYKLKNRK